MKNDDVLLFRLPGSLKAKLEFTAQKCEVTSSELVRRVLKVTLDTPLPAQAQQGKTMQSIIRERAAKSLASITTRQKQVERNGKKQ